MISPVPPQRWLHFRTRQGDPGPHEDAPLKHWPGLNLAGCCALRHHCSFIHPVQPQLLQGRRPAEICSSLSLLRACRGWERAWERGLRLFAAAGRAPGRRKAVWDNGIWHSWTEGYELGFFTASVLNLIIQQLSSVANLSTCIAGEERSFYKNTGTSEYKIMPPPASIIAIYSWREMFISWAV